jgi:hypothetical protein
MKTLAGIWYSERGSRLEISVNDAGRIEGSYTRPHGKSAGDFRLVGMVDPAQSDGNRCLAFVVLWNNQQLNQHSISAWCGQYHSASGDEFLDMTWLLTEEVAPGDDWKSTRIGKDIFHRQAPSTE